MLFYKNKWAKADIHSIHAPVANVALLFSCKNEFVTRKQKSHEKLGFVCDIIKLDYIDTHCSGQHVVRRIDGRRTKYWAQLSIVT